MKRLLYIQPQGPKMFTSQIRTMQRCTRHRPNFLWTNSWEICFSMFFCVVRQITTRNGGLIINQPIRKDVGVQPLGSLLDLFGTVPLSHRSQNHGALTFTLHSGFPERFWRSFLSSLFKKRTWENFPVSIQGLHKMIRNMRYLSKKNMLPSCSHVSARILGSQKPLLGSTPSGRLTAWNWSEQNQVQLVGSHPNQTVSCFPTICFLFFKVTGKKTRFLAEKPDNNQVVINNKCQISRWVLDLILLLLRCTAQYHARRAFLVAWLNNTIEIRCLNCKHRSKVQNLEAKQRQNRMF